MTGILGLEIGRIIIYLSKPFNPRELLARVKAILRRSNGHGYPRGGPIVDRIVYEFCKWKLDPAECH
ncbi:hypothetical protein [Candidatus Coxiella mudrowiae]|uniref:hypothetical protein n=1 Tax=Candidatus Coxiella mudrowiae TaxID=2054173 RepID=UPI002467F3B0|nr:hypothetical protein [Candidatus Coxiella mudrowiae]